MTHSYRLNDSTAVLHPKSLPTNMSPSKNDSQPKTNVPPAQNKITMHTETELNQFIKDLFKNAWRYRASSWINTSYGRNEPLINLWLRLAETAVWVDSHLDLENLQHSLRNFDSSPHPFESSYQNVVESTCEHRISTHRQRFHRNPAELVADGRFIAYLPYQNLADGAANLETFGYFDNNNCPPWDTWIAYLQESHIYHKILTEGQSIDYLLAWVHPHLIDVVDDGIRANPEECIFWLDNSDLFFNKLWDSLQHYPLKWHINPDIDVK